MNLEVVEKRLLGLDNEIHLKKMISKRLKEPLEPTSEIRTMREKQYIV